MKVVVSPVLPIEPSVGEDARRMVRHGLADVLAWLGEEVGPKPGAATHAYKVGDTIFCSREYEHALFRAAERIPVEPWVIW